MAELESNDRSNHWYYTRDDVVHGPFTSGVIGRYLLLGRVTVHDEVSSDAKHWTKIKHIPELIPDVMKMDMSSPDVMERFSAAQRWADERLFVEEETQSEHIDEKGWGGINRRKIESNAVLRLRKKRNSRIAASLNQPATKNYKIVSITFVAFIIAVSLGISFYYLPVKEIIHKIDCGGRPGPGVEWDNCNLVGANLSRVRLRGSSLHGINFSGGNMTLSDVSYSDLSFSVMSFSHLSNANFENSNMKGANLRSSVVRGANFKNADLRYSDFTGADIAGAIFDGADLSKARWVDGHICAVGSVGVCNNQPD